MARLSVNSSWPFDTMSKGPKIQNVSRRISNIVYMKCQVSCDKDRTYEAIVVLLYRAWFTLHLFISVRRRKFAAMCDPAVNRPDCSQSALQIVASRSLLSTAPRSPRSRAESVDVYCNLVFSCSVREQIGPQASMMTYGIYALAFITGDVLYSTEILTCSGCTCVCVHARAAQMS